VLPRLLDYCQRAGLRRFTLVADSNTYPVLGRAAGEALRAQGADVMDVVIEGREIIADERHVMQVLVQADAEPTTYLAVGSGTITDIARFASHRSRNPFISLPTAPSVDGFTSIIAPLVIDGVKINTFAHPPVALFADLDVLCAAPRPMIAAGFGDMIGKVTALADWRLDHLLGGAGYSEPIAARTRAALDRCVERAAGIGQAGEDGVRSVIEGLIETGFCMVEFGHSHPASGAEHHLSHYWEMKLLREGRPAILHGAKVAIGTLHAARRYEDVRRLSQQDVSERLACLSLPNRSDEVARIGAGYGSIADRIAAGHGLFLDLTQESLEALKQRVIDLWPVIQEIASSVPPADAIAGLIRAAGGQTDPQALGLTGEDVSMALRYAHYLRTNFTVNKLSWLLGIG
jgi:glycerol-1-phosphate dehydrogenase [NAD(P)+]